MTVDTGLAMRNDFCVGTGNDGIMSVKLKENYGPYFDFLSFPEQRAAEKFIEAMGQIYPELAEAATVGHGHEDAIYVYVPLPADEDKENEIYETMAHIGTELLLDTGFAVLLMPARESRDGGS